eukprot:TRINITY_DN774157_c0_g1_i1.p1 TRINITY_DN774157_c0_g1~~TRINITY_DN774157_c0_g1_i1.p1  ORF type:complete len:505 (-),score=123.48 TRINITY_DN774157_c0_g1_i1:265-1779(-)
MSNRFTEEDQEKLYELSRRNNSKKRCGLGLEISSSKQAVSRNTRLRSRSKSRERRHHRNRRRSRSRSRRRRSRSRSRGRSTQTHSSSRGSRGGSHRFGRPGQFDDDSLSPKRNSKSKSNKKSESKSLTMAEKIKLRMKKRLESLAEKDEDLGSRKAATTGESWERTEMSRVSDFFTKDEEAAKANQSMFEAKRSTSLVEQHKREAIIRAFDDERSTSIQEHLSRTYIPEKELEQQERMQDAHMAAMFAAPSETKARISAALAPKVPSPPKTEKIKSYKPVVNDDNDASDNDDDQPLYKRLWQRDNVIAKSPEDDKWYFAQIKSVTHWGFESATYKVKFVEYGTQADGLEVDSIRELGKGGSGVIHTLCGKKKNLFCKKEKSNEGCPYDSECMFIHSDSFPEVGTEEPNDEETLHYRAIARNKALYGQSETSQYSSQGKDTNTHVGKPLWFRQEPDTSTAFFGTTPASIIKPKQETEESSGLTLDLKSSTETVKPKTGWRDRMRR